MYPALMRTTPIRLNGSESEALRSRTRNGKTGQRMLVLAQIILLAEEVKATREIAQNPDIRKATMSKWSIRFSAKRIDGLRDRSRSGKPVWFSTLSRAALKGASITSPQQVRDAITNFIAVHDENAAPFQWRRKSVGPKGLKKRYSYLRK